MGSGKLSLRMRLSFTLKRPLDSREIGFGIILSLYAAFLIALAMGWATNERYQILVFCNCFTTRSSRWNWWPSYTVKVKNIKKARHGSDSQMYDINGNFREHEFDQLFASFDTDGDGRLSFLELLRMTEKFRLST